MFLTVKAASWKDARQQDVVGRYDLFQSARVCTSPSPAGKQLRCTCLATPSLPPSAPCRLSAMLLASSALTLMPGWAPTTCTALRSGSGCQASSQMVMSG